MFQVKAEPNNYIEQCLGPNSLGWPNETERSMLIGKFLDFIQRQLGSTNYISR
jgi:hypothetical protein